MSSGPTSAHGRRSAYQAGLIACDYPKEYGGGGHKGFQRIASSEIARAGVPYFINVIGLGMAAPTILHHGTEEQKRRFLPPLFSADEIWCQGFSEPGAGSDLAGAQTFAVRRGDHWVINGHKVWTSLAHFASWMIMLVRTSREHKYDGLTYFIVPIAGTPGVTVRPLIKMTGETGFNEVLFEDLARPRRPSARRGRKGLDRGDDDAPLRARRGRKRRRRRRRVPRRPHPGADRPRQEDSARRPAAHGTMPSSATAC